MAWPFIGGGLSPSSAITDTLPKGITDRELLLQLTVRVDNLGRAIRGLTLAVVALGLMLLPVLILLSVYGAVLFYR